MPKVSVIIPIYNVEKYLRECLDSVIYQTLKDIEIILINDGSPDNCRKIIDEYAQKDNRILVIHKQNGGYGQSCNVGLEIATGEYVAIVEPDDYIDPKMYEDLYNLAIYDDVDIVKSSFYENYDTPKYKAIKKMDWGEDYELPDKVFNLAQCPLFLYFHPSIWSCVYKKEFLNKHNIKFVEAKDAGWVDNPFQVQTMCLAEKIIYTDSAYYYWRKQNMDDSKDLKDYRIPFKRSDEIHNFLKEKNVNDENMLACLYKRELAYINIVLGMLKFSEMKSAKIYIDKMLKRMNFKIIENNPYFKASEKQKLFLIKNNLNFVFMKKKFTQFRKNVISIRLSKREKSVKIFGRKVFGGVKG